MKSICFFASFFTDNNLPYYITVYLKELKRHFSEVVLLSSQAELSEASLRFLREEKIQLFIEKNEGFDFGLWYKAFQKTDVGTFDKIALINDSCILFKPLDEFINWSKTNTADLQGMTFSESVSPHVQSYFLVINKSAIVPTRDYFEKHKLLTTISEVIKTYEIGLSTYLISNGLTISAFMDNNGYKGEFSPYYQCVDYHIAKGIPLIKKKILFKSYRKDELFTLARMGFNISVNYYVQLIKNYNQTVIIDFEKLSAGDASISAFCEFKYKLNSNLIKLLRPFYKLVKRA